MRGGLPLTHHLQVTRHRSQPLRHDKGVDNRRLAVWPSDGGLATWRCQHRASQHAAEPAVLELLLWHMEVSAGREGAEQHGNVGHCFRHRCQEVAVHLVVRQAYL